MTLEKGQFTTRRMLLAVSWFCLGAAILGWAGKYEVDSLVDGDDFYIAIFTWVSAGFLSLPAFAAGIGALFGKARMGCVLAVMLDMAILIFVFSVVN